MVKRNNEAWIAELRGDLGLEAQRNAYKDLDNYLYWVAFRHLGQRQGDVLSLREFDREYLDALAKEFVQDTLEKIVRNHFALLNQFTGAGSFTSWAAMIVTREVGQELRRPYWTRRVPLPKQDTTTEQWPPSIGITLSDTTSAEKQAILQEVLGQLQLCLEKLKERNHKRAVTFWLCEGEGWSAEEVAAVLDITPNAVLILVYRAKRDLRKCLGGAGLTGDILTIFE